LEDTHSEPVGTDASGVVEYDSHERCWDCDSLYGEHRGTDNRCPMLRIEDGTAIKDFVDDPSATFYPLSAENDVTYSGNHPGNLEVRVMPKGYEEELEMFGEREPELEQEQEPETASGYESLEQILSMALHQASEGKGRDRHANGMPFERQRMQQICDAQGHVGFCVGQVVKKTLEAEPLDAEEAASDILGAINYLAGMLIWKIKNESSSEN